MTPAATIIIALIALAAAAGALLAYGYRRTLHFKRIAETLVPPSGAFIKADAGTFHYVEKGEGPVLLFVHGLGGNLHHFDVPLWKHMGEGYRMIAVDRLGAGYSEPVGDHSGKISAHADDMAAFLDALGIDNAVIVGHSLGGAIALALAVRHPQRVAGLALLAPLTAFNPRIPREFAGLAIANRALRRFASWFFAVPLSVHNATQTLDFVFGPQKPPEDFAVAGGALVGVRPQHFFGVSTDFVAIRDDLPALQPKWTEISAPTGILFGTEDRVVDHTANGLAMENRIAGLDLELLDGVGHMPQYARPKETAAFIRRIAARSFAA